MKTCRLYDMQCKDIINLSDGRRLGQVYDLEIDEESGTVVSMIIPGRPRFFGLFGKGEDIVIPWKNIKKIGLDSILVNCDELFLPPGEKSWP